jgi:hypothetical protein
VETLKKRFGDTTLQVCEIMIKDVKDSKRVNGQVQKKQEVSRFRLSTYSPVDLYESRYRSNRSSYLIITGQVSIVLL